MRSIPRHPALIRLVIMLVSGLTAVSADAQLQRNDFSPFAIDINFDVFPGGVPVPDNTQITNQYQSVGAVFVPAGFSPVATSIFSGSYGPLASGSILVTGQDYGSDRIVVTFVDPGTNNPAPTSAVGADIIFRDTGKVATLEVFDGNGVSLGSVVSPPDTGPADELLIGVSSAAIFRAEFIFESSETIAGIDHLIFEPATGPEELISDLIAAVEGCVADGELMTSHGQALINKLDAALKKLEKDDIATAVEKVDAFIDLVGALEADGEIATDKANSLIAAAQAILYTLQGPGKSSAPAVRTTAEETTWTAMKSLYRDSRAR